MSRSVLFVLLLATGVVLADGAPEARLVASAVEAQAPKEDDAKQEKGDAKQQVEDAKQKADDAKPKDEDAKRQEEPKSLSGISILGNQEAPKALVIVPWKSSELGNSMDISTVLDDSRQPVDKDVFMRALRYYEIKSGPNKTNAAQSATAAPRRK
jgi:hypothetical protein